MKNLLFPLAFLAISIQTLAQTTYPTGATGCIARWDFTSSGTVTSVPDVSGNSNPGTAINLTAATGFRGNANTAVKFNGTSSYALVSHKSQLTPSAMTIIALVKMDGFYNGNCQISQIVNKGFPHHVAGNYGLGFGDNAFDGSCGTYSPNNMQLNTFFGTNTGYTLTAGNYVQTAKWYFVAGAYDGNTIKFYQKEMSGTYSSATSLIFSKSGLGTSLGTNTQDIAIGRHMNPSFPNWFNGSMDELILFNKVLTDAEVNAIYDYLWAGVFINQPFVDTVKYAGSNLTVNYTAPSSAVFTSGNTFTVQLSNAAGSFASPVAIGSISSTTSGSISCNIPINTAPGSGYRVRIVASNPSFTSADNGINIRISAPLHINQPFIDTLQYPGSGMNLAYTVPDATVFSSGNTFTAQLSDASGSFAAPVTIGSASSTTSGTISCTIPVNTLVATGYRVRIVSSNPSYTSADNGKNIRVGTPLFINQPFIDTFQYPGSSMTISYTAPNSSFFTSGNTFTAQLSDASGSFASPVAIGVTPSVTSGTISCIIPTNTILGSGYRIRIVASNPLFTSDDNGINIRVAPPLYINQPFTDIYKYPGSSMIVNYTVASNNVFKTGNIFSVQLSDATGNFATSTAIGSVLDTISGSIYCIIPTNTPLGNGYRVRILASKPGAISDDNGVNINIVPVGISTLPNSGHNIAISPNPNKGSFNITGEATSNEPLNIAITNAIGQVVYVNSVAPKGKRINTLIQLSAPKGIYIVQLKNASFNKAMRVVVE